MIGWLRNYDRKPWALCVPYEVAGEDRPMYPDFLVVRKMKTSKRGLRAPLLADNARLRKIIKTSGHFRSDDPATKLIWLALRNIMADWGRATHNWKEAVNQFAILYEDRFIKDVAQYRDRLSHRVGRFVVSADRRRGKISHRLTHRSSDTPSVLPVGRISCATVAVDLVAYCLPHLF